MSTYNKLLEMVKPFLERQNTNMRECIIAEERLAITLRYLATGRHFEDLKFSALVSPRSIRAAIIETCEVLVYVLQGYMKVSALGSSVVCRVDSMSPNSYKNVQFFYFLS